MVSLKLLMGLAVLPFCNLLALAATEATPNTKAAVTYTLAKGITDEKAAKEDNSARKSAIENELVLIAGQLEEVNVELDQNLKELEELTKQTGEEETELNGQREEILKGIHPDDLSYYERISKVRFGEAVAVVRKGS